METLTTYEAVIRISLFMGLLCLFAVTERMWPHRHRISQTGRRWGANLGLLLCGGLLSRVIVPFGAVGAAYWVSTHNIGLLNYLNTPHWLNILIALVLLDLAIYWQHVAMHKVPILWRLHRVHHADKDLDVSSGVRFHPVEILFSIFFKVLIISILGAPASAVILFEIILNGMAMFNHSNTHLHKSLDSVLRKVLVTPDVHRIHHSPNVIETDSNFGFSLILWDKLFGSYRPSSLENSETMTLGLEEFPEEQATSLPQMLITPFK